MPTIAFKSCRFGYPRILRCRLEDSAVLWSKSTSARWHSVCHDGSKLCASTNGLTLSYAWSWRLIYSMCRESEAPSCKIMKLVSSQPRGAHLVVTDSLGWAWKTTTESSLAKSNVGRDWLLRSLKRRRKRTTTPVDQNPNLHCYRTNASSKAESWTGEAARSSGFWYGWNELVAKRERQEDIGSCTSHSIAHGVRRNHCVVRNSRFGTASDNWGPDVPNL